MTANKKNVKKWQISFDELPGKAQIHSITWPKIIKDGSDGEIIIGTPDKGTYMVEKGKKLFIDFQMLYPEQDYKYEELQNLMVFQLD